MSAESTSETHGRPSEAEAKPSEPSLKPEERLEQALNIVNRYSLGAAGVGLVPIPLVDMVSATALQIKMISDVGTLYGVAFERKHQLRNVVLALLGGAGAPTLVLSLLGSGLKALPIVGSTVSVAAVPATFGALTYAVGRAFIQHFEAGGGADNLDVSKLKSGVKGYYQQAKDRFKRDKKTEPAAATQA